MVSPQIVARPFPAAPAQPTMAPRNQLPLGQILLEDGAVDPGNLLLVGSRGDIPVIGAPGCARSPKENGFDWVLQRLLAGIPVTRADIAALGVGGLLMEIVSRPQPRAGGESEDE